MKSRSKVTKRQKVRRTSEMALRFSRGGGMRCEERLWLWDSEVPREARAGKLRSKSQARSPGSLLILVGPHVEVGTMEPQRQGWEKKEVAVRLPGMPPLSIPTPGTPSPTPRPTALCKSPHAPDFTSWQDLSILTRPTTQCLTACRFWHPQVGTYWPLNLGDTACSCTD